MKCSQCGSEKVAGPLKTNAAARMGPWGPTATFEAYVCVSCGNAVLKADRIGLKNVRRYSVVPRQDAYTVKPARRCPICAAEVAYDDTHCRECGSSLEDV